MRFWQRIIENQSKCRVLILLAVGAVCVQAFAQTLTPLPPPSGNLLPLPGAAPTPSLPSLSAVPSLAALPTIPEPSSAPAAPLATGEVPAPTKLPELSVITAAPEPPSPEAAQVAAAQKASGVLPAPAAEVAAAFPQGLPALPLPGITPPAPPLPGEAAVALPEVQVEQAAQASKPKTWMGALAPSIIPPQTNFQYKRAVLPGVIYRSSYDPANRHLPQRVTREDYEALLFTSVARNDVEAARALLNAGTGLEAQNAEGETPLAVARRAGAVEVAALLVARGAQ